MLAEDRTNGSAYIIYNYGDLEPSDYGDEEFMIGFSLSQPYGDKVNFEHGCSFNRLTRLRDFATGKMFLHKL